MIDVRTDCSGGNCALTVEYREGDKSMDAIKFTLIADSGLAETEGERLIKDIHRKANAVQSMRLAGIEGSPLESVAREAHEARLVALNAYRDMLEKAIDLLAAKS